MCYSAEHYLKNYEFAPNPVSNNFKIIINKKNKTITSLTNGREQNTLKLKVNNKNHYNLCVRLLIHLDAYKLLSMLTIKELKRCEKEYDNDMFMKEKKSILGFQIGIQNKDKKFAIKNFEEWKINSQESSDKILEISEEGDLYEDTPPTIGFNNGYSGEQKLLLEEENTYLKIQEANKVEYDDMSGLIEICNICGYWK